MNLSVYVLVATLIQKLQPRTLDVKNKKKKSGKESQNNETEVTTEIKKGKNIFMLQHQIPCRDHISGHNKNFEVATRLVQKSIKVDFKTSQFGLLSIEKLNSLKIINLEAQYLMSRSHVAIPYRYHDS